MSCSAKRHAGTRRQASGCQGESRSPLMKRSVIDLCVTSSELGKLPSHGKHQETETIQTRCFLTELHLRRRGLTVVLWYMVHPLISCGNLTCLWGHPIGSSCVHLQPYRGFGPNRSPFFSLGGVDPHGQLLPLEMGPDLPLHVKLWLRSHQGLC